MLFVELYVFSKNTFILMFSLLFLFFNNYQETIIYVSLIIIYFIFQLLCNDFLIIGIVDYQIDDYYLVDKILYKVKLYADCPLKSGDVLFFSKPFQHNNYHKELINNIKYYGYQYIKLFNFYPRYYLYQRINSFSSDLVPIISKYILNINSYDDLAFNIHYGLISYYLFKFLEKKSPNLALIFIVILSLLTVFQTKYLLIILNQLLTKNKLSASKKISTKVYIISLLNINMFCNYSILLQLLLETYVFLDYKMNFISFLALIESFLFGNINIISLLFYKYIIKFNIIAYLLTIVLIIYPDLSGIYIKYLSIISYINSISIEIKGQYSLFGLIFIYLLIKTIKPDKYLKSLLLIIGIINPLNYPFTSINYIDVGQGDAIMIRKAFRNECILIDTGPPYSYYSLSNYLNKQGIYKIKYLIISHNDSDHNGNIDNLLNDFVVENIITNPEDISYRQFKLINFNTGNYDNDNDNSLVYYLNINNLSFLFTGDISRNVERNIIKEFGPLNIDVLKASHHGSNTANSAYFISKIMPEFAIISTSGKYGHPAKSTIDNLEKYDVDYYLTSKEGSISFVFTRFINFLITDSLCFVII